jgi:hypothetical protein
VTCDSIIENGVKHYKSTKLYGVFFNFSFSDDLGNDSCSDLITPDVKEISQFFHLQIDGVSLLQRSWTSADRESLLI